jgi:type IV secretory pathway VirB3-like protein
MKRNIDMAMPPYMRRYFFRLACFMTGYAFALIGGLIVVGFGVPVAVRVFLAFANAALICGVFWTIFRLLVECDDEYQRLLMTKQTLLVTALTLGTATFWQFLKVYEVTDSGPEWFGVMWLASWGLAAPLVRWRA